MKQQTDFEQIARSRRENTFIGELWQLMREHRKYWLMPIVIVTLMLGLLISLSGTAIAPFIYTLF